MSYDHERSSIETYFAAKWGLKTPLYFDGQGSEPVINSVRLTINSGARLQGSIGRQKNRIDHIGTLVVSIYTDGEKGSAGWRPLADQVIGYLHEVTLDVNGSPITATADAFLRFSPVGPNGRAQQHPYISASFKDMPFHITNVTAPFARYEYI